MKSLMKLRLVTRIALGVYLVLSSTVAIALPFGTFDPRSVAMGGTGVASAKGENAAYYNPALLAQYKVRKEQAPNSSFIFPIINATATDNIKEIIDVSDKDYDKQLPVAVQAYNNSPQQGAQGMLNLATNLQNDLTTISHEPAYADLNIALVIGIPNRREGGSFMVNNRFVIDGVVNYTSEDRALLQAYAEEMSFVAGGGDPQTLHPELYDNGLLRDPTDELTSTAEATAVWISELSMAMSKEFTFYDRNIMFGITPKFIKVTTFDSVADATDNDISDYVEREYDYSLNFDVGVAREFDSQWTGGFVVKNLIKRKYKTDLGNRVHFEPQYRAGVNYRSLRWGTYALDIDVLENDPVGAGDPTQMLALGGEWDVGAVQLRGGVSTNLSGSGDNSQPLLSFGVNLSPLGMIIDLTAAANEHQYSAALQLGVRF